MSSNAAALALLLLLVTSLTSSQAQKAKYSLNLTGIDSGTGAKEVSTLVEKLRIPS